MKICLIHNSWEEHARRGAEQFILTVSAALEAAGHETFVITTKPWASADPHTPAGKKVFFLPSGYSRLGAWPLWLRLFWHFLNILNPFSYVRLARIISREKPDLVWTHNLIGLGFLPFRLAKRYRHYHTLHDIQLLHPSGLLMRGQEGIIRSFPARLYQGIIRRLIDPQTQIISPSQWLLELHRSCRFFTPNKCQVIANPLEGRNFPAEPAGEGEHNKPASPTVNFLYVGQIEKHKGVPLLLEAFSLLGNADARLRLVGEGSLLSECAQANKDPRVEFLGHRVSGRVGELMKGSDCLIVPSLCYENQPTVILEAFASGLAVIGSNFAGVRELLQNEDLLFETTAPALAEKMIWLIAHQPAAETATRQAAQAMHRRSAAEYIKTILALI